MGSLFDVYGTLARSGLFDPDYYCARNPDAAASGLDPLVHYIEHGAERGLIPHPGFDPSFYLEQCARAGERPANPLLHYLTVGAARGLAPSRAPRHDAADGERLLFIDAPRLEDQEAVAVGGGLAIIGWALARRGVAAIEIAIDGETLLTARYGIARGDVAAAYPGWDGAAASGFAAIIPGRSLAPGRHGVGVILRDKAGGRRTAAFAIEVAADAADAGPGQLRRKMSAAETDLDRRVLAGLDWQPQFRVVVVEGAGDRRAAMALTLASLRRQVYGDWRAVVVPRGSARVLADRLRGEFADIARRVRIVPAQAARRPRLAGTRRGGPAFVMALRAGDELGCDALMEFAVASGFDRAADFFYGDERRRFIARAPAPFFKPDWSPDLLLAMNYLGRSWCAAAELVARAGVTLETLSRHGDYDAVLRLTEAARGIRHVGALCHQRADRGDAAAQERTALVRSLARRGGDGAVTKGALAGTWRVRRAVSGRDLVSIIMPVRAADAALRQSIASLRAVTAYRAYEILCIGNDRDAPWLATAADRLIPAAASFDRWRFARRGAEAARGRHLLFLDDAVEIVDPGWLEALVAHAQRPEVGAVGPLLLRQDGTIASAGLFLTAPDGIRHAGSGRPGSEPGYFGLAQVERNVIAVSGACLMTRRDSFEAAGGFDVRQAGAHADLDYCLSLWRRGLANVFTPQARLIRHGRGEADTGREDAGALARRWRGIFLDGDPFVNRRLSPAAGDVAPEREPVERVVAGRPLIAGDTVKRILAVKLDHLGDCVTALPALRRLKHHFPAARLSVLSGPWAKAVWALEPAIDEIIDFSFFSARSGLGARTVAATELAALERRLKSCRFDLAVDLRKIPDTRPILQRTGARHLAGFDHGGRFPWLDVALEWDADPPLVAKRQAIGDDFVNLADAVAASCAPAPRAIVPRAVRPPPLGRALAARLFARPVVCVHPAAGNALRQWPAAQFAELIALLIERCSVHVAIIGRPDERPIVRAIMERSPRRDAVFALPGRLTLAQLPMFLTRCVLFVGNNSGPKHLAAGLGVPTVAIHSGVVDSIEWGPVGPNAVAIRRAMACAPCYLQQASDCPRALACLTGIGAGEVYRACERLLALAPAGRMTPILKRRLTAPLYP